MAKNDFFAVDPVDRGSNTVKYEVQAGATTIQPGEPVIQDAGNPSYVIAAADGASNADVWIGVAATESTQSASADGEVYVIDFAATTYTAKATTPANLTQTILNTKVTVDLNSGVYTVDELDTTNGVLTIKGFDAEDGTVDVQISQSAHISN